MSSRYAVQQGGLLSHCKKLPALDPVEIVSAVPLLDSGKTCQLSLPLSGTNLQTVWGAETMEDACDKFHGYTVVKRRVANGEQEQASPL